MENVIVPDVLLVIGNGFDRKCDLKSSYYEFLLNTFKENEGTNCDDNNLLTEYENYLKNCRLKLNISEQVQDYTSNKVIDKLNLWYLLFLYKKTLLKKDWNFIEEQILQEVLMDHRGLNIFSKILFGILTKYIFDKEIDKYVLLISNGQESVAIPNIYNVLSYYLYYKVKNNKENNIVYKNLFNELGVWREAIQIKIDEIEATN